MTINLFAIQDDGMMPVLSYLNPKELAIVSLTCRDGNRLAKDAKLWKELFLRYTRLKIPNEVNDTKKYFTDRVVWTPTQMFAYFRIFVTRLLIDQAHKITSGQGELWRARWECYFSYEKYHSLTFIAQNVKQTNMAQVFPSDLCIYLGKDDEIDPISGHWVYSTDADPFIKTVQIRAFLPLNFAGLSKTEEAISEDGYFSPMRLPISASACIQEEMRKIFTEAVDQIRPPLM